MKAFRIFACFAAAACLIALPSWAAGAYDPVGSGTVKISFDRGFLRFLEDNRVKLDTGGAARVAAGTVSLPIVKGSLEPTTRKARTDTEGVLVLRNARNRVLLRNLTTKTKRAALQAKVGGSQMKVAYTKRLQAKRRGFGIVFAAKKLRLSSKVAGRLNKKLRPPRPFTGGQLVGSAITSANPTTVTLLDRNRASLEFAPSFLAKLNGLFVSVNPIFPAERTGALLTLPLLSGGTLSPSATAGTVKLAGDVEFLQLHSNSQIFTHEFWLEFASGANSAELNLQPTPPFEGMLPRAPVFGLQAGAVSNDVRARTITVSGSVLTMQAGMAQAFNNAFGEGDQSFAEGEPVAFVSFVAQGH